MPGRLPLLLALCSLGCASVSDLAHQGRWNEAAHEAGVDPARRRELLALALERTDATLEFTLHSPDSLAAELPYLPARIRDGSMVLGSATLTLRSGPVLELAALPGASWSREPCCDPMAWLHVDGRDDEIRTIRDAEIEVARRKHERDARSEGRFGNLLSALDSLAGLGAGLAADVAFIATVGVVDIDVANVPGSVLSPLQLLRTVGGAVAASARSAPSTSGPGESQARQAAEELARKRGEAAVVLNRLLEPAQRPYSDQCFASAKEPTSVSWWLFKAPDRPERVLVHLSVSFQAPPGQWKETVFESVELPAQASWSAKEMAAALRAPPAP